MAGGIDMAKNWIRNVRKPLDDQEPVNLEYFNDKLPAGPYTEGCRVDRGSPQSIPDATSTYVIFDTEDYDTDGMHDLVVNPDRVTIKTAGIYLIVVHFYFGLSSAGYRRCYIYRNATTICQHRKPGNAVTWTAFNISTIHQFTVGQYIRVKVYQNSGAPLLLQRASHYTPYLMAQRIG